MPQIPQRPSRFAENGIRLTSLTTLPRLLDVAVSTGHYRADTVASYREFLADQAAWQRRRGIEPVKK
jgi:hypothetical protein